MSNIENLYTAKVRGKSPDGSVTAMMTVDDIRVELAPNSLRNHRTDTLATQLKAALNGALDGWRKVGDHVMPSDPDATGNAMDESPSPLDEALARVEVTVEHPAVKLGIFEGGVRVAFAPEALTRHETTLANELNVALVDLLSAHRQRVNELIESHTQERM